MSEKASAAQDIAFGLYERRVSRVMQAQRAAMLRGERQTMTVMEPPTADDIAAVDMVLASLWADATKEANSLALEAITRAIDALDNSRSQLKRGELYDSLTESYNKLHALRDGNHEGEAGR